MPEDIDSALDALTATLSSENQVAEPAGEAGVEQPQESPPSTEEAQTSSEEVAKLDMENLPPEVQAYIRTRERQMQADYTRKTQEAAELRKQAEAAIQFTSALESDPEFAWEVYNTLGAALEAAGYSKQEAQQIASQTMEEAVSEPSGEDVGLYFEDEEVKTLKKELEELKSWKSSFEEQLMEKEAEAYYDKAEAVIRQQHPEFTDEDIRDIFSLALAYDGDPFAAKEAFMAQRDRILASYLQQKKTAPNTTLPVGTGIKPAESLKDVRNLAEDERVASAAEQMLLNALE